MTFTWRMRNGEKNTSSGNMAPFMLETVDTKMEEIGILVRYDDMKLPYSSNSH